MSIHVYSNHEELVAAYWAVWSLIEYAPCRCFKEDPEIIDTRDFLDDVAWDSGHFEGCYVVTLEPEHLELIRLGCEVLLERGVPDDEMREALRIWRERGNIGLHELEVDAVALH